MPRHALTKPTRKDSTNLAPLWMSTRMQKINFIHQLFLEVLEFQESWNLIGQEHFGS